MSKWHEPKEKDVDITDGDINAWIDSDDDGNIYVSFKLEVIKKLIKEYDKRNKKR